MCEFQCWYETLICAVKAAGKQKKQKDEKGQRQEPDRVCGAMQNNQEEDQREYQS